VVPLRYRLDDGSLVAHDRLVETPRNVGIDRVQQRRHGDAAGAMRSRGFKPLIERGGHAHKTSEVALM
jgi:hypothetical protein